MNCCTRFNKKKCALCSLFNLLLFIFTGSDDEDDGTGSRYRSSQRASQPISKVRIFSMLKMTRLTGLRVSNVVDCAKRQQVNITQTLYFIYFFNLNLSVAEVKFLLET